jgi:hypothetical protein
LLFGTPIARTPPSPYLNVGVVRERVLKPREGVQLGSYVEDEGKALFNLTKGLKDAVEKMKAFLTEKCRSSIRLTSKKRSSGFGPS